MHDHMKVKIRNLVYTARVTCRNTKILNDLFRDLLFIYLFS